MQCLQLLDKFGAVPIGRADKTRDHRAILVQDRRQREPGAPIWRLASPVASL